MDLANEPDEPPLVAVKKDWYGTWLKTFTFGLDGLLFGMGLWMFVINDSDWWIVTGTSLLIFFALKKMWKQKVI